MLEVKHMSAQKKEAAVGTDEVCVSSSEPGCVYETQDWMFSPSCSPEHSSISPLLAEETFRYMTLFALGASSSSSSSKVLSSDRVEQMTRTYNDIDVVTHLLAERDRDLELAARIGQSLLQRNHVLQERNDALEEQLTQALDQVHQLQHELVKKDELLRVVSSVSEESETDSGSSTPQCLPPPGGALAHMVTLGQLEALQNKLQELEEENLKLRSEASQLKKETCTYEEKEQQLVSDCVKELRESNSQMVSLSEELSQKNEDLIKQQEEIAHLLAQIVQLQQRLKELALEKEELRIHLQASKDSQRQLTAELNELADRNAECVGMLHESQEEVKELRSKSTPSAGLHRYHGLYPLDSLAAEIEGSMRREMSVEEEMTFQDQRSNQSLVFRTVRSANEAMMRAAPPIPGSGDGGVVMTSQPFRSHTEDPEHASGGCAGRSRGGDVVSALRRLTLRRQNVLSERQYFQAERNKKLQELAEGAGSEGCGSGCSSPMGSVRSSFTNLSELSGSSTCFRTFLPEKLQIVKPMEGSLTLHHWQQLAKPHLASVLDLHPGVITKGFRPLPQDALYHLSDLEEDEDNARAPWAGKTTGGDEDGGITFCVQSASTPDRCVSPPPKATPLSASVRGSPVSLAADVKSTVGTAALPVSQPGPGTTAPSIVPGMNPGKCQSSTFSTYTFTTCRILHPSDVTQVTPSYGSSPSACGYTPSSLRSTPSTPVTPCRLSVGESSPPRRPTAPPGGLAKLVLEKGISAQRVPPPAETAPPLHLPPRTPPNSPCPSPDPFEPSSAHPDNFLASRPAELFLQDVYGLKPDLVERLRRLGLDKNVIRGAESSTPHQHSTLLSAGGGSLLVGLRRNQSVPAMISKAPPSHPTSLPLPAPSWGNLKPRPNRRHTSLSETPPSGKD